MPYSAPGRGACAPSRGWPAWWLLPAARSTATYELNVEVKVGRRQHNITTTAHQSWSGDAALHRLPGPAQPSPRCPNPTLPPLSPNTLQSGAVAPRRMIISTATFTSTSAVTRHTSPLPHVEYRRHLHHTFHSVSGLQPELQNPTKWDDGCSAPGPQPKP